MVSVKINGKEYAYDGDPNMPLLWFIRDEANLTGTKYGCGISACGSCTVLIDGAAVRACGVRAGELAGKKIENIYDYTYAIEALKAGQEVELVVTRDGKEVIVKVVPGSRD